MINNDTPEAIAITDKAAKELLEVEKLKAVNAILLKALRSTASMVTELDGGEELYPKGHLCWENVGRGAVSYALNAIKECEAL